MGSKTKLENTLKIHINKSDFYVKKQKKPRRKNMWYAG